MNTVPTLNIACTPVEPTRSVTTLAEDVETGLFAYPRTLPPKYFYDERGSLLFDRICDAPEYYPTRTESALLERVARDVIAASQPECIVELGSGTSRKTRHLFDACELHECYPMYRPFDVCDEILVASGETLQGDYEWLEVQPMIGDYTAGLGNLPRHDGPTLVVFLGGTIGNFTPAERHDFLRELRDAMSPGDRLLLGADRVKQPDVLHAAYNDREGITADFNLNVLRVMNRELGADFDLGGFEHYAHFNPRESRIEMHLIAMRDQKVRFSGIETPLDFSEGDYIRTEVSTKFTKREAESMLCDAGFAIDQHYESDVRKFSLLLARAN